MVGSQEESQKGEAIVAYVSPNFKTKKALKDAVTKGDRVTVYQPNDMFGNTEKMQQGEHTISVEGPHFCTP